VKRKIKFSSAGLILATLVACAATNKDEPKIRAQSNAITSNADENTNESAPKISPAEAVKVRAGETNVRVGERVTAEIEVLIAEGFHTNANPASFEYLQPTELRIEKVKGLTIEKPIYPNAESKKFGFAEVPIAVYEGTATIKLRVRADKKAKRGRSIVRGTVRAQPCNENACFPPRTKEFSLLVRINP
jgi:hypothetical protein